LYTVGGTETQINRSVTENDWAKAAYVPISNISRQTGQMVAADKQATTVKT